MFRVGVQLWVSSPAPGGPLLCTKTSSTNQSLQDCSMLQVRLIKAEVKLALQKRDPYRSFPECSRSAQHDSTTVTRCTCSVKINKPHKVGCKQRNGLHFVKHHASQTHNNFFMLFKGGVFILFDFCRWFTYIKS